MSVRAYRIAESHRANHMFDGEGAFLYGGRWNTAGHRVVYCAGSLPLAVLEMLVHFDPNRTNIQYVVAEVVIPDDVVESIDRKKLPKSWADLPLPQAVQDRGDRWIDESRSAVLEVPSAVIQSESNYLLNPEHPDFDRIEVGKPQDFRFDPRLLPGNT